MQYDTPQAILAQPANEFVECFVGADRALRRLALIRVDAALEPWAALGHDHRIVGEANLRNALAAMMAADVDSLAVVDANGKVQGIVTLAGVRACTTTAGSPSFKSE